MRKLNYAKSIKKIILLLSTLLIIVCISFSVSYSNFIYKSSNHRAVEMFVNKLNYSIKINDIETSTFTIAPGNSVINVKIKSLNKIDTYFKLLYSNDLSLKVYNINNFVSGKISSDETISFKLFLSNYSNENISGTLYASGGYINNGLSEVEIIDNYNEINSSISIGDYINYAPNGIYDLTKYSIKDEYSGFVDQDIYLQSSKYRIFNIKDDGTLEIISDKSININNLGDKLNFGGYLGYNNGEYLLNDLIKNLYGTSKYTLSSRNTSINDITSHLKENTYDVLSINKSYNNIYYLDNNDSDSLSINKPKIGNINLSNSYWTKELFRSDFSGEIYYTLLMNSGSYWLSSKYNNLNIDNASWGLFNVSNKIIIGSDLYNSINNESNSSNNIRPIIRLSDNIKLSKNNSIWEILEY